MIGAPAPANGGRLRRPAASAEARALGSGGGGSSAAQRLAAPLQGSIFKVVVEQGAEVEEGALICVIEAMKMENEITAHRAGKVTELAVKEGAAINAGDPICTIE